MPGEQMGAEAARRFDADQKELTFFRHLVADGNLILGTLGFGIRIDRNIRTLAFDHKKREVLINPDFIEKQGLTKEQKRYVFSHEISHFVQLVQDSDTYLSTFEIAKKHGNQYTDPEVQDAVRQAWNNFFNVFLDIHDNAIVDARSMWTQSLPKHEHPRQTLYENLTSADSRGAPKTEQFNFAILRKVMMGVELEVQVDDDVAAILETPFKYGGMSFPSIADFAKKHFFDPNLPLNTWLSKLNRSLAPIFKQLLELDVSSGKIKEQTRTVELSGEDQDGDEIGEIVDGLKQAKESGSARAKRLDKERYKKELGGRGFGEGEISVLEGIRERTSAIFPDLVDQWEAFVQKTIVSDLVRETGFTSGEDVNLDDFVRELPTLFTQPDRARFMERSINEPLRESERPKSISLIFSLDLSGSMDAHKRRAVQDVAYAISRSLIQYQRDKKNAQDEFSSDIVDVDLRLIGFGSTHQDLFLRTASEEQRGSLSTDDPQDLEARLARSVLNVGSTDLGGTDDTPALNDALTDTMRPEKKAALDRDDGVVVVIEITDGETSNPHASKNVVQALNKQKNVFARGIQIEGMLQADTPALDKHHQPKAPEVLVSSGAFETVWGKHGQKLADLSRLKELMLKILFSALREKQKNI